MDNIWYNHRRDNQYTGDKYGEQIKLIKIPRNTQVRSLVYSKTSDGKNVMAWKFSPMGIEPETAGFLMDDGEIAKYADENFKKNANYQKSSAYAIDNLMYMSETELYRDWKTDFGEYKYSPNELHACLRIANRLYKTNDKVTVVLSNGGWAEASERAIALTRLILRMLPKSVADKIGFVTFLTNNSIAGWANNVANDLGLDFRLFFKYGDKLPDFNGHQADIDDVSLMHGELDGYFKILSEYVCGIKSINKTTTKQLLTFVNNAEEFGKQFSCLDDNKKLYYGAAYSYVKKNPKAIGLYISTFIECGCPLPDDSDKWVETFKLLTDYAQTSNHNINVFKNLYLIYKTINPAGQEKLLKILYNYCKDTDRHYNKAFINGVVNYALNSSIHGEVDTHDIIPLILYRGENAFAVDGKNYLENIFNRFSGDIYHKVLCWVGLIKIVNSYPQQLNEILNDLAGIQSFEIRNLCPADLLEGLNEEQAFEFVSLIFDKGKVVDTVTDMRLNFSDKIDYKEALIDCTDILQAILLKFYGAYYAINWERYEPIYSRAKTAECLAKINKALGVKITEGSAKRHAEDEQLRIQREEAERKRQAEEAAKERKRREAEALKQKAFENSVSETFTYMNNFGSRASQEGCAGKEKINKRIYAVNVKPQKEKRVRKPNAGFTAGVSIAVGLILSLVLSFCIAYVYTCFTESTGSVWKIVAFDKFLEKFINDCYWVICAAGLIFYLLFYLCVSHISDKREHNDKTKKVKWKITLWTVILTIIAVVAISAIVVLLLRLAA